MPWSTACSITWMRHWGESAGLWRVSVLGPAAGFNTSCTCCVLCAHLADGMLPALGCASQHFGLAVDQGGVYEFDSSTDAKHSRHLLVRIPGHAFINNHAMGQFVAQASRVGTLLQCMLRHCGALCLQVAQCLGGIATFGEAPLAKPRLPVHAGHRSGWPGADGDAERGGGHVGAGQHCGHSSVLQVTKGARRLLPCMPAHAWHAAAGG